MSTHRGKLPGDSYDISWWGAHSASRKHAIGKRHFKNRITRRARRKAKHDLASEHHIRWDSERLNQ